MLQTPRNRAAFREILQCSVLRLQRSASPLNPGRPVLQVPVDEAHPEHRGAFRPAPPLLQRLSPRAASSSSERHEDKEVHNSYHSHCTRTSRRQMTTYKDDRPGAASTQHTKPLLEAKLRWSYRFACVDELSQKFLKFVSATNQRKNKILIEGKTGS